MHHLAIFQQELWKLNLCFKEEVSPLLIHFSIGQVPFSIRKVSIAQWHCIIFPGVFIPLNKFLLGSSSSLPIFPCLLYLFKKERWRSDFMLNRENVSGLLISSQMRSLCLVGWCLVTQCSQSNPPCQMEQMESAEKEPKQSCSSSFSAAFSLCLLRFNI